TGDGAAVEGDQLDGDLVLLLLLLILLLPSGCGRGCMRAPAGARARAVRLGAVHEIVRARVARRRAGRHEIADEDVARSLDELSAPAAVLGRVVLAKGGLAVDEHRRRAL